MIFHSSVNSSVPVIVIPGGGVLNDGTVPPWTQLRLDKAVTLYKQFKQLKLRPVVITLSGGTPHKPNPRDEHGFAVWEATAAARRLIDMGIPFRDVYEENFSFWTT